MDFLDCDLIFDGGFSTQLVVDGHNVDGDPLWSARLLQTNPEAIVKVHKRYYAAGADVVISSSYQASVEGFKKYMGCNDQEAVVLMQLSAKLLKRACDEFWNEYLSSDKDNEKHGERMKPLTCASLGPYGACLADGSEYSGSYVDTVSNEELISWHDKRLSILANEDMDLYIFETFPALEEAKAVVKLMEKYANIKFVVSFSCKDEACLNHGETFKQAVQFINTSPQVVGVGVNCTSPQYISGLLRSIQGLTDKKILVMANSGAEWTVEKRWSSVPWRKVSEYVKEWKTLGANWIGGCCTVGPSEVTDIRRVLHES